MSVQANQSEAEIAYAEITIHDTGERVEGGGVDEERRHKMDLAGGIRVLGELRSPTGGNVAAAKRAGLSRKCRDERLSVDLQLSWARRELSDEVAKSCRVVRGCAWEGTRGKR